jgi:CarD family transcriptional regulator
LRKEATGLFSIGDRVVHPIYGAGTIVAIEKRQEAERLTSYYVIPTETPSANLLIPVDRALDLGLREVITREAADEIVQLLRDNPSDGAKAVDLAKAGKSIEWSDPRALAKLVRDGSVRAREGRLPLSEKKVLKRAQRLLLGELSLVTGLSRETIEAEIGAVS